MPACASGNRRKARLGARLGTAGRIAQAFLISDQRVLSIHVEIDKRSHIFFASSKCGEPFGACQKFFAKIDRRLITRSGQGACVFAGGDSGSAGELQ